MDKFVPYEKLSKKKKRQLDAEKRGSWYGLKPITRKPKNPKAYDRKKARCWRDDSSNVLSSFQLSFNSSLYRPGSPYSSASNSSMGFSVREAYAALPGPSKSYVPLSPGSIISDHCPALNAPAALRSLLIRTPNKLDQPRHSGSR